MFTSISLKQNRSLVVIRKRKHHTYVTVSVNLEFINANPGDSGVSDVLSSLIPGGRETATKGMKIEKTKMVSIADTIPMGMTFADSDVSNRSEE
jgi:hypothetical protein